MIKNNRMLLVLAEAFRNQRSDITVSGEGVVTRVWNEIGGVLHWTHIDPRGSHRAGWLRHAGRTYQ